MLTLIEQATGKDAYVGSVEEEGQDMEADEDTVEAELTIGDGVLEINDGYRAKNSELGAR